MSTLNPQNTAFNPIAAMQIQAVTSTAATVLLNNNDRKNRTLRVVVEGTETVFIRFGRGSTQVASATVADVMMLENTIEVFSIDFQVDRFSVFSTAASGSSVFTTVGEGV